MFHDDVEHQVLCKCLVRRVLVKSTIRVVNWLIERSILNNSNQLLHYLTLQFEAREMSAISHVDYHLSHQVAVEHSIKQLAYVRHAHDFVVQVPDRFQRDLHHFRFLVFDAKDHGLNNCVELVWSQL